MLLSGTTPLKHGTNTGRSRASRPAADRHRTFKLLHGTGHEPERLPEFGSTMRVADLRRRAHRCARRGTLILLRQVFEQAGRFSQLLLRLLEEQAGIVQAGDSDGEVVGQASGEHDRWRAIRQADSPPGGRCGSEHPGQ